MDSSPLRQKLAFIDLKDPRDPRNWSGIPSRMVEGLGGFWDVAAIGPLVRPPKFLNLRRQVEKRLGRGRYLHEHSPSAIAWYRWQIRRHLARERPAALLAMSSSVPAAAPGSVPAFFWSDSTVSGLAGYYAFLADVNPSSLRQVLQQERRAFARCANVLLASDWAAETARTLFPESAGKVRVVPFGANFDPQIDAGEAERVVAARPRDACHLLFLGVEWERKGGPDALEAARILNARGVDAVLTVVGCRPEMADPPPFLRVEGFLRRDRPDEAERLDGLLRDAHFLVLPSRAEAFGVVFCEAAAYAVPSLATRTGGIPTAVVDGRTGMLFDPSAPPASYADAIEAVHRDGARYRAMALAAHADYESRLNWRTACTRVTEIVRASVAAAR